MKTNEAHQLKREWEGVLQFGVHTYSKSITCDFAYLISLDHLLQKQIYHCTSDHTTV